LSNNFTQASNYLTQFVLANKSLMNHQQIAGATTGVKGGRGGGGHQPRSCRSNRGGCGAGKGKTKLPFSPEEWAKLTPEQKAAVTKNK
jgi:hypothetical protein